MKLTSKTNPKYKRYWIVVGKYVAKHPFRHPTKPEAITEAKRLSQQFPRCVFAVYEAQAKYVYFPQGDVVKLTPEVPDSIELAETPRGGNEGYEKKEILPAL